MGSDWAVNGAANDLVTGFVTIILIVLIVWVGKLIKDGTG